MLLAKSDSDYKARDGLGFSAPEDIAGIAPSHYHHMPPHSSQKQQTRGQTRHMAYRDQLSPQHRVRITTTADQTGLEDATRTSAPEYAHRGTALHKYPLTNSDQQILWHKPTTHNFAGVHDFPDKNAPKHNATILLLNAYALAQHTDQATHALPHIKIKPYILPHAYRSEHTISLTHTEQGTHLPPIHTRQIIQPPHTYRAKHTTSTHI